MAKMSNRNKFLSAVGGVGVASLAVVGLMSESEPEQIQSAPEPVFSEEQKQDLLRAGIDGFGRNLSEAATLHVITATQADRVYDTAFSVYEAAPESLVTDLRAANDGEVYDYLPLGLGRTVPYEITKTFEDFVSLTLREFNNKVSGKNGCMRSFQTFETAEAVVESFTAHLPHGVADMSCENGNEVKVITYPADMEGVKVSYNFEREAVYFQKTGYSARDCDGNENDCFAVISFTELKGSDGLNQAFADKAEAENRMTALQTKAQEYFAKAWPQISQELKAAEQAATVSSPAPQ